MLVKFAYIYIYSFLYIYIYRERKQIYKAYLYIYISIHSTRLVYGPTSQAFRKTLSAKTLQWERRSALRRADAAFHQCDDAPGPMAARCGAILAVRNFDCAQSWLRTVLVEYS